jgi:UDP-N-acetylglucosamine 1-carboxyvinyltransferase
MDRIIIRGGTRLRGTVRVSGAKNAALPLLAASLLANTGTTTLIDVPTLGDVQAMIHLLRALGADVHCDGTRVRVHAQHARLFAPPRDWVGQLRASFTLLGPLLARHGEAIMPLPGGCAIGTRPIDQHLKALRALGAEIDIGQGMVRAVAPAQGLTGAVIALDVASVGATQNAMMAACLARGTTVISNAACEPEIIDLAHFLCAMGAHIDGAGTPYMCITGVAQLRAVTHTVIPDRIEAGTYMIAAAMTGGRVYVERARSAHMRALIDGLEQMGVHVTEDDGGIFVRTPDPLRAVHIDTAPHPGFPTDLQAPMMALMLRAQGTSTMRERVFENRYQHVAHLCRMGGQIDVRGDTATMQGPCALVGAEVAATDLRAAAALLVAALGAKGETTMTGVHHLDRGYMECATRLRTLGAHITRTKSTMRMHVPSLA